MCVKCDSIQKNKKRGKKCVTSTLSFCDNFFIISLAGLTENLNFQLLKHKGCEVEIETIFGTKECGVIYSFGIDYIEIKRSDGTVILFLKDKINKIHLIDNRKITVST